MSLIDCQECNTQVSSLAAACPHCGAPISQRSDAIAAATPITTTQQTAKRFKGGMLAGAALLIAGVVTVIAGEPIGGMIALLGLIVYIAYRIKAWWHHG
mgnify:CR=1 FL=1